MQQADAKSQVASFTHGNNVQTTHTFDTALGRLIAIQAGASNAIQHLGYSYDAIPGSSPATNITFKSDVGTYGYSTQQPHAVATVTSSGLLNATYSYDTNGNMLSGAGRTSVWTSFNMPESVSLGSATNGFAYDDAHGRIKQTTSTGTTLYVNALGLKVERIEGSGGSVKWNNYVYAAGGMVAVFYEQIAGGGTSQTRYFHKDHLGSIGVITDELGAVVQRLAYDAWGKRRNTNGSDEPIAQSIPSVLDQNAQTDRGFTGHEHLQELALVHTNGRLYDPLLGITVTVHLIEDGSRADS